MSAGHSSYTSLDHYWLDDYKPLQDAAKDLLVALREDENAVDADLCRRIGTSGNGSHRYFSALDPLVSSTSSTNDRSSNNNSSNGGCSSTPFPSTPINNNYSTPGGKDNTADAAAANANANATMPSYPPPTITMKHERSVPLPPYMAAQLQTVKSTSLMGLLTQAGLAWLTVDDKLFLWPYASHQDGGGPSFCSFQVPHGQCVLSVGLAKPKPGVFRTMVQWCLVVTTADEVILCALATNNNNNNEDIDNDNNDDSHNRPLRLVPTHFSVPTDGIRMISVCGTLDGRIFLGGEDGCLYEVSYAEEITRQQTSLNKRSVDERLELFYNSQRTVPATLREDGQAGVQQMLIKGSKRVLSSIFGDFSTRSTAGGDGHSVRPTKCRKLNRSSKTPVLATTLLPEFLIKAGSFVLGGGSRSSKVGGSIEKMVVDEERGCLYTLGAKGWICSYNLRAKNSEGKVKLAAVMNTPAIARTILDAVSQQRMTPPSRSIFFPGGGTTAQKGVGGMQGARSIVSLAKTNSTGNAKRENVKTVLTPISMHVVPRKESSKITLVAVTQGGLRYYISSLPISNYTSYGGSRTSVKKDDLAPCNTLFLCHIRAPPPLTDEGRSEDLSSSMEPDDGFPVGGFAPKMSNKRMPEVDASFYGMGAMVLAVKNSAGNQSRQQRTDPRQTTSEAIGDHIVATAPDFVNRKGSLTAGGERAPGGVTETLSLPLSSSSSIDNAPILPGGLVSDIAESRTKSSAAKRNILNLMLSSQTPTDSELSVGLIPEFTPSTAPVSSKTNSKGSSNSTAVATWKSSFSSTAMAVAWNMLPNLLLSRPLISGIPIQKPRSEVRRSQTAMKRYKISTRYGSSGFSLTAADIAANKKDASMTRRSARLNPWLLRPSVVPLNPLTLQHLLPSSQVVAMNTGGLQYFQFTTILSEFADTLTAAGENVDYDERVTTFFRSYGHAEGCAMCVLLAINQGPAAVYVNRNVKSLAARAALARAYTPSLSPIVQGYNGGIVTDSVSGADPLLPPGYTFRSSALLDGVIKVVARLLRPVWHKPLVVVTEGRTIELRWKSQKQVTPAKVELLLDDETVSEILNTLSLLVILMKDLFKKAIDSRPGASRQDTQMMDIDRDDGQHLYITDGLIHQSHMRDSNGEGNGQLSSAEAERIAILTEERKIHSLFRLVTRVQQLLRLVALLARANSRPGVPEVEWGNLHGLTVSQLVQTSEGQDRLEKTLNSLVTSASDLSLGFSTPSLEADTLAKEFAKDCYLFFSPGAHYAYLGFSFGSRALSSARGSVQYTDFASKATRCFRLAAPHWHKTSMVASRSIQAKGQAGYQEAAQAAMKSGSPIAKATSMLVQLEDVKCAVEVCLTTANNFSGKRLRRIMEDENLPQGTLPWEHQLYHKRHDVVNSSKNTSSSAVTAEDAIKTCWSLIFFHLTSLLQYNEPLGVKMVSECAGESDKDFLREFFQHMMNSGNTSILLRVASAELELWLKDVADDQDLLPSYYVVQNRFFDAGRVYADRAKDNGSLLSLEARIDNLSKASNMFTSALKTPQPQPSGWGAPQLTNSTWDGTHASLVEAKEMLDIAKIQYKILTTLSTSPGADPSLVERLRTRLEDVTELFDIAIANGQAENVLLIQHTCHFSEEGVIEHSWKQILCESIFPCSTRSHDCYAHLQELSSEFDNDESITLLSGDAQPKGMVFENGDWATQLEMKVVSLGKQLFGSGYDCVFPVHFLLDELDSTYDVCVSFVFILLKVISCLTSLLLSFFKRSPAALRKVCVQANPSQSIVLDAGWALKTMANAGVPYMSVIGTFEQMSIQGGLLGGGEELRQSQLAAIVSLLEDWVTVAANMTSEKASIELSQAVHSAHLLDKVRRWRHEMETMGISSDILEQVEARIEAKLRQPSF